MQIKFKPSTEANKWEWSIPNTDPEQESYQESYVKGTLVFTAEGILDEVTVD